MGTARGTQWSCHRPSSVPRVRRNPVRRPKTVAMMMAMMVLVSVVMTGTQRSCRRPSSVPPVRRNPVRRPMTVAMMTAMMVLVSVVMTGW